MKIEIIEFNLRATAGKVGHAIVKYYDISLHIDLVYGKKPGKEPFVWLRMPEKWVGETKYSYCFWDDKNISDQFQILTLKLLFDKYHLSMDKLDVLWSDFQREYKSKKDFTKRSVKKGPNMKKGSETKTTINDSTPSPKEPLRSR